MNVPYTNLYDEVLPDVPGVPQNVALNAIRNAVIEFCDRSGIWIVDIDPVSVTANNSVYPFVSPTDTVVSSIIAIWFNLLRMHPTTELELADAYINWKTRTGLPVRYLQENTEELIIFPMPAVDQTNALTIKVALKPTRKSTGVEGWIIEKYQEGLAHGAKAKLFAMQKKPWTSAELSAYHFQMFEIAIAQANLASVKGLGKGRIRTVARFV
jgi:hypothetical protein